MALNYNWTTMNTFVDSLQPDGNTNQGIGLQIGWMSLVGGPFTVPAKDPNYSYSDVIVLVTDGLNTQNRWYTDQTSIDTREATTCANAKAAKITIYTVFINTGGDPSQAVLKNCASAADKAIEVKTATQTISAFATIGTQLSKLRIAQ